ncbi:MAG: ATP-binding cassette domain-containing protein [Anaerolineae bacterium]
MSIVLQNLFKQYATHTVVDHVSLEVHDGEMLVLLGPSGSGKSTILRMIAGLIPVEGGRILLHGRDVTDLPPQERNTGFVFQNYSLFRHMTVAENIEFGLEVRRVSKFHRKAKSDELLALVGLGGLGSRLPRQLSGGQQQRVAVARALAFEPSVLLLDEPFGALDVKIREQLRQVLKDIQRKLHVTTILVTHDQEEAFELADRIGVIERGRLLEVGAPTALYRSPQREFTATFLGGANLLAGAHENGRINLGALRLADAASPATPDPEGRLEVLFRPEDLTLATKREELDMPVLGQGTIHEVLFLGTMQRIRLHLQPLPGTWPLPMEYGETGVPIQIARVPRSDGHLDFQIGQTVWVGINNFHVLPRIPMRLLVVADDSSSAEYFYRFCTTLAHATDGPVTILGIAEESKDAEALVQQARELCTGVSNQITYQSRPGRILDEILRELKPGAYDLLVVADQPRRPSPLRQESLTRQIVRQSPIPILVFKGNRTVVHRMLFCTAGGEPGKRDIVFGGRLARRTGAATALLYVDGVSTPQAPHSTGPEGVEVLHRRMPPWIENHLEEGANTLLNQGIRTQVKVRQGAVVTEIFEEADEGNYDIIVVGGHIPPLGTRSQPDLASEILTRSDRPVLVVSSGPNR